MDAMIPWKNYAETYGFLGNSLLKPMTMTATVGLDPAFWESFPSFGDERVATAIETCAHNAAAIVARAETEGADAAERCAVEYTRLFVGPPSPAAPPWETMYRGEGVTVGFGQATFEMRALLREAGLEVRNENNQYEDHLGIELLYLSELCRRAADAQAVAEEAESAPDAERCAAVASFIEAHPLSWTGAFRDRIVQTAPEGYFAGLTQLVEAVLRRHAEATRAR